jgi:hypothetical protein
MALTITDFASHIYANGVQAVNKWHIHLTVPKIVQDEFAQLKAQTTSKDEYSKRQRDSSVGTFDIEKTLSLMATTVSIPGVNVAAVDMTVGTTRKIAFDKSTGELNINFRCSGNMKEKKLFDAWIKKMFRSDHSVEFYDNYIGNIEIECVSVNGDISYNCVANECYPITITDLNLDRQSNDTVLDFQVTFAYRKIMGSSEFYSQGKNSSLSVFSGLPFQLPSLDFVGIGTIPKLYNPNDPNQSILAGAIYRQVDKITDKIESGEILKAPARRALNILKGKAQRALGDKSLPVVIKVNSVLDKLGFSAADKPTLTFPKLPF